MIIVTGCAPNGNGAPPPDKEKPEYGGIFRTGATITPTFFDDGPNSHVNCYTLKLTNEEVWTGDWAQGYAGGYGTNKSPWIQSGGFNRLEYKTGQLAEKVEWTTDLKTITLSIRSGVYWQDKFPANGRELTAEDVAYSLQRQYTSPVAYMKKTYPETCAGTTISVDGNKVILTLTDSKYFIDVITMLDYMNIFPKDALETFGDMIDWENSCGTGPFILTDYVSGDSITYVRNENYWGTDPVGLGEGNQLPYVDEVVTYIVPDASTSDSMLMTGQIDTLVITQYDRAKYMLENCPDLEYVKYLEDYGQAAIFFRTDKSDRPYQDERVRWALSLAIDREEILDTLYGGEGTILKWPIMYFDSYKNSFVSLEDLEDDMIEVLPDTSISVADLYDYNPELAKDLLEAAGYPEGFSAKIVFYDDPIQAYRNPLTMVVAQWAEVGVDVEMVPKPYAEFSTLQYMRTYDDMVFGWYSGIGTYMKGINWWGPGMYNASFLDDPVLNQARQDMLAAYPDEAAVDAIHRDMLHYLLGKCYAIGTPAGYYYRFWWPWVKNYGGETSVGYYNGGNYIQYIWIDQEMKEDMGY